MAKTYSTGLIITGDSKGAVKATELTSDSLKKLGKQAKTTKRDVGDFEKALGTAAHKATAWGVGIAAAAVSTESFFRQFDEVDKIHKLNLRMDASTEALSAYQYVADLSGTTIQQLSLAWQRQTRRISEASAGYGEARSSLQELGLEADQLKALAPEEQFYAIATALEKVGDKSDRLRLANKIFDSEGAAAALQIINQGTDAIDGMIAKAHELNVVISQDQANAIADYNDAVTGLSYAWDGVNKQLAYFVAESSTGALNDFAEVLATSADAAEYLDDVMALSAIAVASKYTPALFAKTKARVADTLAIRAAVVSEYKLAKALADSTAADLAKSQASAKSATTQLALMKASVQLTAAENAATAAKDRLTAATSRYNAVAITGASVATRLNSAMAFMGGPVGVAMLAAGAISYFALTADGAKEPVDVLRRHTDGLGESLDNLSKKRAEADLIGLKDQLDEIEFKHRAVAARIETLQGLQANGWIKPEQQNELILKLAEEEKLQAKLNQGLELQGKLRAIITGEFKKSTVATDEQGQATGRLTVADEKRLEQMAAQVTQLEKLRQEKEWLLSKEPENEKQQKLIAKAIENKNRQIAEEEKRLKTKVEKNKELLPQLEEELRLMKLSERERFIENQLRGASATEMAKQGDQLRELLGIMYDEQQRLKDIEEAAKEAEKAADPFADAWEESTKRIDEAFANAWEGAFDSFEDFGDALLDSFKKTWAEMAHLAMTKPITLNMQAEMERSGGGLSGMLSSSAVGLDSFTSYFNPSSGSITRMVNSVAGDFGYGWAPDGMGPPTLIDPNSATAGALNSLGAGFSAYGFAQEHGVLGGVAGGAASTAIAGGIGGLASGAGFMSGASGALAGLGPMGWAAIGVGALLGGMGGGETRSGQRYLYDPEEGIRISKTPSGGPIAKDEMTVAVQSTIDNLNRLLETLGSTAHVEYLKAELKTSEKGRGGVQVLGELSTGESFGERYFEDGTSHSLSSEEAVKFFIEDLHQATIQGLQAADIGGAVGEYLAGIADPETLGLAETQVIVDYITGFTKVNEALETGSSLFDFLPGNVDDAVAAISGFSLEGEALTSTFARVTAAYSGLLTEQDLNILRINESRQAIDEFNSTFDASISSADQLKDFALGLDLTTESGREAFAAVTALAPAIVDYENRTGQLRDTITSFYTDILGREPDTEGLELWLNAVAEGTFTLEEAAEAFANSEEAARNAFNVIQGDAEAFAQSLADQNLQDSLSEYDKAVNALDTWYQEQLEAFNGFIDAGATFAGGSEAVLANLDAIFERDLAEIEGRFSEFSDAVDETTDAITDNTADLQAAASERLRLENQLLQLQGDTEEIRKRQRDALDESNRAIFDKITALEDLQAATAAAEQTERELASQREAIASERYNLETQLLQLQGDITALQEREKNALDESNHSLYEQIKALEKLQEEAEAAAAAEQALASKLEAIASERYSLETQLLQLQGNITELRKRERDTLDESNQKIFDQITALEDLQAETAAAEQAERDLASQREAIASERYSLETRLLQLQGNLVALQEREKAALDESNHSLYEQIKALEAQQAAAEIAAQEQQDAADAIAKAEQELADKRQAIASEKYNLEGRLLELQGNLVALQEREKAAIDESNHSLYEQIKALEAQQEAAEAAAKIESDLAAKRNAIASERYNLEGQLLELLGDEVALRERQKAAIDESNYALFDQIVALESKKAADALELQRQQEVEAQKQQLQQEANAQALEAERQLAALREATAAERYGLETQLLQAQGNITALRRREMEALAPANRALYQQIKALEDQKTASEEAAASSRSLIDEIYRLRGLSGGAEALGVDFLSSQFESATAAARAGDLDALADLPSISQSLEAAAAASASTALDVQRMNAWLANSMAQTLSTRGIEVPQFASGGNHQGGWRIVGERGWELEHTGASQIINHNDSMKMLDNREVVAELRGLRAEVESLRAENKGLQYTIAKNTGKVVKKLNQFDAEGMPEVRAS
ncbi:DUF4214 domain-containing protein [Neptuniibacter sp.]|uniref:DUF4214 domain-containing protein n=1 Tax=Neptuniibacter sp. TaxID=1962643 RepID=UPI0026364687|nr:DUF4214 domain-containing protein [Neptuniibacter sp.]MCP4595769.1 DUF4214 domain-containing protein [Neptuniibacter sp.]